MTARVNIIVEQGSTFYQEFQLYDENNDPLVVTYPNSAPIYTSNAMMRKSYQALNSVSFDTSLSNGMLILGMTANATANITAGRYVYDAELTSSAATTRIIEGIVTISPEATK